MLDVATRAELLYLCFLPVPCIAAWFYRLWLPLSLGGYFELAFVIYVGFWFTIAVFLDRRLDFVSGQRRRQIMTSKLSERESRLMFRREMAASREEVQAQAAEAQARGRLRAQQAEPAAHATPAAPKAAPPSAGPSIDDLLR